MKKPFLFLLALITLIVSCSDDDDNTTEPVENPILGTWYLVDFTNPLDPEAELSECNMQSYITFEMDANGNQTSEYIYYQSNGIDCLEEDSSTGDSWSNEGNTYNFTLPQFGQQEAQVSFEDNNTRMVITNDDFGGFSITFEK